MGPLFSGVYTAIITPFNSDQSFDDQSFKKLIERQIAAKVNGLVILGTTGEAPTVEFEETLEIFDFAKKAIAGRCSFITGVATNCTHSLVQKIKKVTTLKPDGILVAAPYYNKPTQKGLFEHYSAVAGATDRPVILYNVPGRTGVNIEAETTIKLSAIPNIAAIKEASGNLEQVKRIVAGVKKPSFVVVSGNDDQNISIIKLGGKGTISVASNAVPGAIKKMVDLALSGNFAEAEKYEANFASFFKDLFIENNPQAIKTLLASLGLCQEVFRLPLTTMLPENKAKVIAAYDKIKAFI